LFKIQPYFARAENEQEYKLFINNNLQIIGFKWILKYFKGWIYYKIHNINNIEKYVRLLFNKLDLQDLKP